LLLLVELAQGIVLLIELFCKQIELITWS